MPLFVTPIDSSRRAPVRAWVRDASSGDVELDAHGYRRRLAALHTPAPDTLRARVRRELRAAAAAATKRPE